MSDRTDEWDFRKTNRVVVHEEDGRFRAVDKSTPPRPETVEVPDGPHYTCKACGAKWTADATPCPHCGCRQIRYPGGDALSARPTAAETGVERTCEKCGVSWAAPVVDCPECDKAGTAPPPVEDGLRAALRDVVGITGGSVVKDADDRLLIYAAKECVARRVDLDRKAIASLRAKLAEAEAEAAKSKAAYLTFERFCDHQIAAQAKRIAELEAGLRPFYDAARRIPRGFILFELPYGMTSEHLRHARALLSATPLTPPQDGATTAEKGTE